MKAIKIDATRCLDFSSKCVWRPGSARTRWGSLSAPPDPLAAKRGPTSKGRGREGREGEGWERRGGMGEERRGRKGKWEGKGSPLPRNPRSATVIRRIVDPISPWMSIMN